MGIVYALLAATLFGCNSPFSKLLIGHINSQVLAGLLCLGAAISIGSMQVVSGGFKTNSLQGGEWLWFILTWIFGAVLAPALFVYGVSLSPASTVALLMSLEGTFTAAIAWIIFREKFHWQLAMGISTVLTGSIILIQDRFITNFSWGNIAVIAACLCWATDNNLTRKISHRNVRQIAFLKNLGAAPVNIGIGLLLGANLPEQPWLSLGIAMGITNYGLAFIFLILGLRYLGASRAGAYFSVAPFVGTTLSIILLRETITFNFVAAAILIAIGLSLCIHEQLTTQQN